MADSLNDWVWFAHGICCGETSCDEKGEEMKSYYIVGGSALIPLDFVTHWRNDYVPVEKKTAPEKYKSEAGS